MSIPPPGLPRATTPPTSSTGPSSSGPKVEGTMTSVSDVGLVSAPSAVPSPPASPRSPLSAATHLPARPSPLGPSLSRVTSNPTASSSRLSPAHSITALPATPSSPRIAALSGLNVNIANGSGPSRLRSQGKALGMQDRLKRDVDGVVKRRSGGVLGRGFILKTDHYPTGRAMDLDLTIQGAPNFRSPHEEGLNVYGVAQPTTTGLQSILTILGCEPAGLLPPPLPVSRRGSGVQGEKPDRIMMNLGGGSGFPLTKTKSNSLPGSITLEDGHEEVQGKAAWFSTREETLIYCNGRPYVLRDASSPFRTLTLSDRTTNLEDIERRLKFDILEEARKYGGLILTHDEVSGGAIIPTWVSVDEGSIRTPKELWQDYRDMGWRVDYWRIPIAPDTPIEDNYLDTYVSVLRETDPFTTSLVFNCGMGVVRTTFGMIAAMLVRRKQVLLRGLEDPFPSASGGSGVSTPAVAGPQAAQLLEQASHQQVLNTALLKLTRVLEETLPAKQPTTAIDLLATQPVLLEQLRRAHMGNYQIVMSLLSSLDNGRQMKRLVDAVIDDSNAGDAVVNLRENVIRIRLEYSVASMDDKNREAVLDRALRSLEQYFDLIVFAAYVEDEDAGETGRTFSQWLKLRPEIWNQIKILRRQGGNRLSAFAPANDLSLISRSSNLMNDHRDLERRSNRNVNLHGGKILGDEWADHVVNHRNGIMLRTGTLLKSDLWLAESAASSEGVRGAIGFRQVLGTPIFATGQPTQDAISTIIHDVKNRCEDVKTVVWVCLREEPLVMINGSPYCLRRDSTALRNMRDYTGVSASRLEVLEERLKSDVISEVGEFQGKLLLHSETADGEVVPVWESVDSGDVASLREVMEDQAVKSSDVKLQFVRIPITSESSPDFHDLTELLDLCMSTDLETTAFILNDQLGRGRSSNAAVIALLIERWLRRGRRLQASSMQSPQKQLRASKSIDRRLFDSPILSSPRREKSHPGTMRRSSTYTPKTSWQIINSCLRVIRNGLRVKKIVDEAIDATSTHFNLREAIEDFRVQALETKDPHEKHSLIEKGIYNLRRYYHLMVFQAYLDDRSPEDENPYSFESFVRHRPVFRTLETELEEGGLDALTPIARMEPAAGLALPDEVTQVVADRSGAVLSAQTILKSDFFSGLQKQSLPERVDGAANYRKLELVCESESFMSEVDDGDERFVYGTGMPNSTGLRNALKKMNAGPDGTRTVTWTSLREEPVLYVKGRPHVLRLVDKPFSNVETTGITNSVVERMEGMLKDDVLREIQAGDGRILLHDEKEIKPGQYEVVPIWETVQPDDVMTPKELYDQVMKDRYRVDYARVAITDEQAPLPVTLHQIVSRVAKGIEEGHDFVFNCQMGRGRTTTGMVVASLIATVVEQDMSVEGAADIEDDTQTSLEDGLPAEANQYLDGEYKTILQLVTVLSHGKQAKRITDRIINNMEGVQNLRKAVYDFKLKVDAAEEGTTKYKTVLKQATNYLYRYGALIVLANFLLEMKEQRIPLGETDFPAWLQQHREIRTVLSRKGLD